MQRVLGTLSAMVAAVPGVGVASSAAAQGSRLVLGAPGAAASNEAWRVISIDHRELLTRFGSGGRSEITLALPEGERTLAVELESFEVFAADAAVVVDGMNGERMLAHPDVLLLRGGVVGDEESAVFLGSSGTGVHGYIQSQGRTWVISTGPNLEGGAAGPVVIAALEGDLAAWLGAAAGGCTVLIPPGAAEPVAGPGVVGMDYVCRLAEVAIETDWEFTGSLFGGSTEASGNYAAILVGAVSEIYRRDLNMGLQIKYLRLWDDPQDPWTSSGSSAQLTQFRSVWNSTMGAVQRDAAHMLSGRSLGGGVAWLGAVCGSYAYAVSGNLGGTFPYPLQNNNGANWDVMVVAHEWGHNFGAQHTHDLVPAPDLCGAGNCAGANTGTIMSYCHTCSGGMANVLLEFHQQTRDQMDAYLAGTGACVAAPAGTIAVGEMAVTAPGTPIEIDVLVNDIASNCDVVSITEFGSSTFLGGAVERLAGAGPNGRDLLRYTPPAGVAGLDVVSYTVQAAGRAPAAATVSVTLLALRDPAVTGSTLGGMSVAYYELSGGPTVLPDFGLLTPYQTGVVSTIAVPSTNGVFGGSGREDEVGATYEGYLVAPEEGLYTLFVESDDGSRVWLGQDGIILNDGLHGMIERSGVVALKAGAHRLRVDFFENGGGAGLILRVSGPNLNKQVVPAAMLVRDNPCRADLTTWATPGQPGYGEPNGLLNNDDFFFYLAAFSSGNVPVADLTSTAISGSPGYGVPNGQLTNDDFFFYLGLFAAGC